MGVRLFREPDAVTPPVRFDEREQETEPGQTGLRRVKRKPSPTATGRLKPLRLFSTLPSLRRLFAGNERLHGRDSRPVLDGACAVTLIASVAGVRSHPGLLAIVDFSVVVGARLVGVRAALAVAPRVLHVLRKVTARLLVRIVRRHPVASLALSAGCVAG